LRREENLRRTESKEVGIVFVLSILMISIFAGCMDKGPANNGMQGNFGWNEGNEQNEQESMEFIFPANLSDIDFDGGGFSAFGIHAGDHPEGLDHIWVYCKSSDDPVLATANGTVYMINHREDYSIILKHSERFMTEYGHLRSVLVEEGETVKQGQPIGYPIEITVHVDGEERTTFFFDYWLKDLYRNDGVWVMPDIKRGSRVSPYEYLEPTVREAIENAYYENMYNVYKEQGKIVGSFDPYEPNLTNDIFLHPGNEGTPVGVWISLERRWEVDGIPDMITIIDVDNEFWKGYRFIFYDGWVHTQDVLEGNCTFDLETGRITFEVDPDYPDAKTYYGIFEVIEGERATLHLEYSEEGYPESFSENMLTYVVRSQKQPRLELREIFPDMPQP